MKFYMPTRVFDEENAVQAHAAELAKLGRKALIMTGRSSAVKCGALGDVEEALQQQGRAFCVFNEVEENPSVETIVRAAELGLAENADFVIGIGGGSPMDAAKAAAFLMKRAGANPADLYDSSLPADALPVAAIPTTCGTGSEVTGVSVLTRHDTQSKGSIPHKIFPELALVDAKYLKNAPQRMLINTSVDAFAHLAESYVSTKADDYSMAMAVEGLKIWSRAKDFLLADAGLTAIPASALRDLLRASTFAGMAIAQTGTCLPHALSYIPTYELGMPHGMAVGVFLTAFLKEESQEDRDMLMSAAGFADFDEFEEFMRRAFAGTDAETLSPEVRECAFEKLRRNEQRLHSARIAVDEQVLRRICGLA